MKQNLKSMILSASTILMLGAASTAAQAACLAPDQVQAATASGQILPLATITSRAGVGPGTSVKVLKSDVCESGGALYYELSILDKNGNAGIKRVDAASGAALN